MGKVIEFPVDTDPVETPDVKVAFPKSHSVLIGETEYPVPTFRLGKSMLVLEAVADLIEQSELTSLIGAAQKGESTFVEELFNRLPLLFKRCRELLFRLMAVVLIPDVRLAEMDTNDEDVEAEIAKMVRVLKYDADMEKAMEILPLAVDGIGLDTLRKNLPKLLSKLGTV